MSAEKRTNVRMAKVVAEAALELGFGVLQSVSPTLASRAAANLFMRTPPRRQSRALSTPVMKRAKTFTIQFGPDSERIAVWSWGSGPVVLLVHGWGGRASQLRSFVDPLVDAGFRVVTFDAPGHGESGGRMLSLPEFGDTVKHVAEAVSAATGSIEAFVAHSFGGAACAVAVTRGLNAECGVMIGTPAHERDWFEVLTSTLGMNESTIASTKSVFEQRFGAPIDSFRAEAIAPQLALPLLVVHDADDKEVPWENGASIARAKANATLLTTSGLGHRKILADREVIGRVVRYVATRGTTNESHAAAVSGTHVLSSAHTHCRRCGQLAAASLQPDPVCDDCGLYEELANPRSRVA